MTSSSCLPKKSHINVHVKPWEMCHLIFRWQPWLYWDSSIQRRISAEETESRVFITAAQSMIEGIQDSESMRLKGLVVLRRLNGMGHPPKQGRVNVFLELHHINQDMEVFWLFPKKQCYPPHCCGYLRALRSQVTWKWPSPCPNLSVLFWRPVSKCLIPSSVSIHISIPFLSFPWV